MSAAGRKQEGRDAGTALGWRQALATHWQAQPPRQKGLVALAIGLVTVALLWWIALAPALSLWREVPQKQRALDLEMQTLQTLESQARMLRQLPQAGRDDARRALEASVQQQMGTSGRLQLAGDSATLTLTGARGEALAQWLAQARIDARTRPISAQLSRNAAGLWEGTLTLALPAQ